MTAPSTSRAGTFSERCSRGALPHTGTPRGWHLHPALLPPPCPTLRGGPGTAMGPQAPRGGHMSGVAFPGTGLGGLISAFRGAAGVERRSSGGGGREVTWRAGAARSPSPGPRPGLPWACPGPCGARVLRAAGSGPLRPGLCAVSEGGQGALPRCFQCRPVLLHRPSFCPPSEWSPACPRPRF